MTRFKSALVLASLLYAGPAVAQSVRAAPEIDPASALVVRVADQQPEVTQPSPSDRVPAAPSAAEAAPADKDDDKGKNGDCDSKGGFDACCDADPWELFPETCRGIKVGGWIQAGYHSQNDGTFNSHPDALRLHQTWLYAERKAKGGECSWDWGFRTDILYGVDAQDTQSFGNDVGVFDFLNGWDHGIYGWALPQAYAELAYDKLTIKGGHFFTYIGYEVVQATGNFFYSHAFTHYWSEPFTHTGVLGTYDVTDELQFMAGWTLGWDTGFDSFDANHGNSLHAGVTWQLTENIKFIYMLTGGSLGWRGDGYSHSLIFDVALTEKLKYVLESDLVAVDGVYDDFGSFSAGEDNDDHGINQYLIYTLNDCWAVGGRMEWWEQDGSSAYELTGGVNWKPHPNFVLRPEIRYQWGQGLADNLGLPDSETIFGMDAVVTF
jgi:hypothetical protein